MIRGLGTTIACACLAGAMGVGLFFVKHEVKEQEARLSELNQEIHANQEAIHVLKAEWSYLNDPARLRALSEKFLSMKVMGPTQIASLDALPAAGHPAAGPGTAVAAARPLPPAASPAPAAKPVQSPAVAPTATAKAPAPARPDAKPAAVAATKAPTATVAATRPALVPGADTTPRVAAAPVAAPQPAPPPRAPGQPGRAIVVQSPALASTPALPGEVR